jgi:hypothetical protein
LRPPPCGFLRAAEAAIGRGRRLAGPGAHQAGAVNSFLPSSG